MPRRARTAACGRRESAAPRATLSSRCGWAGHARARGMTQIARDAGMSRESLYRALGEKGNPEFATVLRVLQALGLRLTAVVETA